MKKLGVIRMKLYLLLSVSLAGCATVEHKTTVNQAMGVMVTAGIGDTVLRTTTEKNLPNLFGKADIFGRTTPTARTTVVYEGIRDGKALFRRNSIDIETGATTMNSTPMVINNNSTTRVNGNVGGVAYSESARTYAAPTVIAPNTPAPTYMAGAANIVALDLQSLPTSFVVDGVTITVHSADGVGTQFSLKK